MNPQDIAQILAAASGIFNTAIPAAQGSVAPECATAAHTERATAARAERSTYPYSSRSDEWHNGESPIGNMDARDDEHL